MIDFHTHAFPDALAPRAIPSLAENMGIAPKHDGTVSGLLALMEQCGISRSVVLNIATNPSQENAVNSFAIRLVGHERLIPFGSVFPGSATWREQLERLKNAGVRGVKLHPEYQNFDLDCPEALAIYRRCGELGLIVLFHAGEDAAFPPPIHTGAVRINRVCESCPDTVFVAAHFGGYNMWEDTAHNLTYHDNLYLDTSMTCTAARPEKKHVRRILETVGVEHILLGSDSPWEFPGDSVEGVRGLGLSNADTARILSGNAVRLLGL